MQSLSLDMTHIEESSVVSLAIFKSVKKFQFKSWFCYPRQISSPFLISLPPPTEIILTYLMKVGCEDWRKPNMYE